jgi:hypothetical protein
LPAAINNCRPEWKEVRMMRLVKLCLLLVSICAVQTPALLAQVTTGAVAGLVVADGGPVEGANVIAVHQASGTRYGAISRADGRFTIPGMRVGGPYTITVSHIGYESQARNNVFVNLGAATDLSFSVRETAVEVEGVIVTAERETIISADRTGASSVVTREALASVPALSARLQDVTRLSPQSSGGLSFAGADSRLNNITVDGSYFNNSFGLRDVPGSTSGVAPISMAAIEQVQVNIAPYDVRQGNFVGAAINTVTRSGTNDLSGSLYYSFRNQDYVGDEAGENEFDPGNFDFSTLGGWLSGPIIRDKLFFFGSYEDESLTAPGTTFRANTGGETVGGNITRVLASDLTALSSFLSTNFGYETGSFQGYDFETPAKRYIAKLDYNLNDRNKVSLRYNHLDSFTDVLMSNSSSLGFGNRRTNTNALNFLNSNYQILENIRSIVGEWNSMVGTRKANQLIVGYTFQDESRDVRGSKELFPMVDILLEDRTYTSFGFEPFTPNNELRYKTWQLQNNFTFFGAKHELTFGLSAQRYESENVFFQGAQSAYTYNSLADFYTDANAFLNNADCQADALSAACRNRQSPVTLRIFQVGYNNIPTNTKPIQPLKVFYGGLLAQDEYRATDRLKLTLGLRVDAPFFEETGYANVNADALTFRDEDGNNVQYSSGDLPDAKLLLSPRFGFNWDVKGDRTTQVRGGSGIFTGPPAYVWISNQVGNTGMLTGFERSDNTTARPFNPNPDAYKPTDVDGTPAASYALAVTDPDFKFPQVWRSNVGVDHRLPLGLVGTAEFIYNRDVNGIYYINANLPAAQTSFVGADDRPRWTSNRINNTPGNQVTNAIVLKNQSVGRSWHLAGSLERPFSNGLFLKAAYSYGESENTVDPGSIASGSWQNNVHSGDPNNPGLGLSANSPGHRLFVTGSYRREWFSFGATTIGLFWSTRDIGNASYQFANDMNGDGGFNDLIYVPRDASEMNFQEFTSGSRTFTVAEQQAAWDAYINQDEYLSSRRGQYAERGAVWLPRVTRADMSISQDLFTNIRGKRNTLSFRADVVNIGNLLNSDWGVAQRLVSNQPLTNGGADSEGRARYRLRVVNNELINKTFEPTAGRADVWEVGFSMRYTFN